MQPEPISREWKVFRNEILLTFLTPIESEQRFITESYQKLQHDCDFSDLVKDYVLEL